MRNAAQPYIDWYKTLPEAHQSDIASFCATMLPDHPLEMKVADRDLAKQFVEWIERSASKGKFKAVGTALTLIKITEFVFINQRGSQEDWAITAARMADFRDYLLSVGNTEFAAKIELNLQDTPDRAAGWIATSESWKRLRMSLLSDDALHSCLRPSAA